MEFQVKSILKLTIKLHAHTYTYTSIY